MGRRRRPASLRPLLSRALFAPARFLARAKATPGFSLRPRRAPGLAPERRPGQRRESRSRRARARSAVAALPRRLGALPGFGHRIPAGRHGRRLHAARGSGRDAPAEGLLRALGHALAGPRLWTSRRDAGSRDRTCARLAKRIPRGAARRCLRGATRMTRKTAIRAALVALPLAAFLLYAALNWYTIEDEAFRIGASEAAMQDPYLAYGRLLEGMGASVHRAAGPSVLQALPAHGTLLLTNRRLAYMTPQRVRAIREWVDNGGALVVAAEPEEIDDPLLDNLGIERIYPERMPDGSRKNMDPRAYAGASAPIVIDWPQLGRPLKVQLGTAFGELRDTRVRTDVNELRQGERVVALSFASGQGRVTVLPSVSFLRNTLIGNLDHAELGWRLVAAQPTVTLYLRMTSPPFLEWVRRDAWPVVAAAALLLVLWLARIIARFGPLVPDAPPVRRSLLEHVVASGRFLWSRGAGPELVEAVRERVARTARRRGVSTQPIGAQAPGAVIARLDAPAFTQRIASLQKLEEGLARRERPGKTSQEGRR